MGKILSTVLALAILGYLGYRTMYGRTAMNPEGEAPKQRLENAQNAANRIEQQQQQRAEQDLEKSKAE
jgi:hypothetical protein